MSRVIEHTCAGAWVNSSSDAARYSHCLQLVTYLVVVGFPYGLEFCLQRLTCEGSVNPKDFQNTNQGHNETEV